MLDGIKALALAQKYTEDTVIGAGAIIGKNCKIKSIENITGGHRVTFEWFADDNTKKTSTMDVMDGAKGDRGEKGESGDGIIAGGTTGQFLRKASDSDFDTEWTNKPTYNANEVGAIPTTAKGALNGVAELDSSGKVPSAQLPASSAIVDISEADYYALPLATRMNGTLYMVHYEPETPTPTEVDLTPRMTSATSSAGTASGTGTDPSYVAWKAFATEDSFDVRNTDGCFEANNSNYLQFDFNRTVDITKLSAASYTPSASTRYSYWNLYAKREGASEFDFIEEIYIPPAVKPNYIGQRTDIALTNTITNCKIIKFVPADSVDIIGALHIYGYNTPTPARPESYTIYYKNFKVAMTKEDLENVSNELNLVEDALDELILNDGE